MANGKVMWTGLVCCVAAILVKMFPSVAFSLGVDLPSAWLLFAFGVFLIVTAMVLSRKGGAGER